MGSRKITVKATEPVTALVSSLGLKEGERCRLFCGDRELTPQSQAFAEFGVVDGDKIAVYVSEMAPYLLEYFDMLRKLIRKEAQQMINHPMSMMNMFVEGDKKTMKEYNKERREEFGRLRPLIEASFDHHDRNKNEVLDQQESAFFFGQYVTKCEDFAGVLAEWTFTRSFRLVMEVVEELPWAVPIGTQETFVNNIKEMKKCFDNAHEDYLSNKKERDAAAFGVLDSSKDGELQKFEVVAALMPNSKRNMELLKTLGFDIEKGARQMISGFDLPPDDPYELQQLLQQHCPH